MEDWEQARKDVLERLVEVRRLIDAEDEGAVLALISQQDAFCDEATDRRVSQEADSTETQCHFCEGYIQSGGCFGHLDRIDRAILSRNWEDAGKAVDEYIDWVKRLSDKA